MATILSDRQQLEALASVNTYLEKVRVIDTFLASSVYTLASSSGRKSSTLVIDSEYTDRIRLVLSKMKDKSVREIYRLSTKYRLQLSEEENALLIRGSIPEEKETTE